MNALASLFLAAGASLSADGGSPRVLATTLSALAQREGVADALESFLDDEVCGRVKAGVHRLPGSVAAAAVALPWDGLALVSSCGVKPLELFPEGRGWRARLVWELEGRAVDGQRAVERGEGDASFSAAGGRFRWESFRVDHRARVQRPARRFTEVAQAAGLSLPARPEANADWEDLFRGGLTVRDLDGDGRPDIVVVTPEQAWLFRSDGPLHYAREPVGPPAPAGVVYTAAIAGDFDDDGAPDLVLLASGEANSRGSCLLHNRAGHFEVSRMLDAGGPWHSGIAADLDGDGELDLVVVPYPRYALPDDFLEVTNGAPPRFFLGDGRGGFRELPVPRELARGRWGLAAAAGDITGQGRREVYVANDFGSHDLWWLAPDGGLMESAAQAGLTDPGNGMSVDLGDVHGTGRLDLYVANMFSKAGTRVVAAAGVEEAKKRRLEKFARGNTLYLSTGDGGFEERGEALGVNRGLWAFGSIFLDYDDDGRLDVGVADGFLSKPERKDL